MDILFQIVEPLVIQANVQMTQQMDVVVEHIYIYDPAANTWKQGAEIPVSRRRGSTGAVVRDGMIYLLGGIQNGHSSGWVPWFDAYNPQTNAWTILSDAPRSRDHFHAILEGDKALGTDTHQFSEL